MNVYLKRGLTNKTRMAKEANQTFVGCRRKRTGIFNFLHARGMDFFGTT